MAPGMLRCSVVMTWVRKVHTLGGGADGGEPPSSPPWTPDGGGTEGGGIGTGSETGLAGGGEGPPSMAPALCDGLPLPQWIALSAAKTRSAPEHRTISYSPGNGRSNCNFPLLLARAVRVPGPIGSSKVHGRGSNRRLRECLPRLVGVVSVTSVVGPG